MTELLNTLYVQTQGASLYLEGDTVRVVIPDDPQRRTLPLRRLQEIVAFGNVNFSSPLLARCAEEGRPIIWMSAGGRFLSRVDGPTQGNVLLRHAQHLGHSKTPVRLTIAKAMVAGKLQNSRQLLLRGARDNPHAQDELRAIADHLARALPAIPDTTDLDGLRGIEGNAARQYFRGLGLLFRNDLDVGEFPGRTKRPATDPVNAMLSFTYGLTRSTVHGATEQVGLDPTSDSFTACAPVNRRSRSTSWKRCDPHSPTAYL